MSTTNNTYEAGLIAAMNALDALSDTYLAEAQALGMATVGEANYDADADTFATGRYSGAVRALGLIAGMVSDYRKASA